ncbi:MAG: hypothetical protein WBA20_11290, partial [Ketobacter sp.]
SLLQFTLVQGHTPDRLLGRVNSLWNAQDVTGDAAGAMGIGVLARLLTPLVAVFSFGVGAAALGVLFSIGFGSLRRLQQEPFQPGQHSDSESGPATESSPVAEAVS